MIIRIAAAVAIVLGASAAQGQPGPPPRDRSGQPQPSPEEAAGTIAVQVVYNDPADPAPGLAVTLVGYAADERVTVATRRTDREGRARFTGLDRTGATAYFAMALPPRGRVVDRLVSRPVLLDGTAGVRMLLSGERRGAAAAALDDLPAISATKTVGKGKLDVELLGIPDATSTIKLIDAATRKPIASEIVIAPDTHAVFDVPAQPGQVLYAESAARGELLRSLPFHPTAGGAAIALHAVPRLLVRLAIEAEPAEPALAVRAAFEVQNNSWIPYRAGDVPLPRGFRDHVLHDDGSPMKVTATGVQLGAPLPPGGRRFDVDFKLPAVNDKVRWELDLPHGAFDSRVEIARDAGMTVDVDAPSGVAPVEQDHAFVLGRLMIPPKGALAMTIGMPKLPPAQKARARACSGMSPDRRSPLRDRPMPDFTAKGLDGKPLRLASLRGKLLVVNFTASWSGLARDELPTFAKAAAAIPDLAVVVVTSDEQPDRVGALIGAGSPLRVVLDPPPDPNADPIGPIARAWKVGKVPESYVIDRGGTVRLYLVNKRDWGSAEAIGCLEALK